MCIAKTISRRRDIIYHVPYPVAILENKEDVASSQLSESHNLNPELVQSTIEPAPKIVQHHYTDHAVESPSAEDLEYKPASKGGVISPFPIKLYEMLENVSNDNFDSIVHWQLHGRCFLVHKITEFVEKVLPKYFQQRKYASFQRQLNLYGFNRITQGPDKGCYYHDCFLRGRQYLCHRMQRIKVKGTIARMASNPNAEPNFYAMPPLDESIASQDDDIVLFEGRPFHYIDLQEVKNQYAVQTLNRASSSSPRFNPNTNWVTDDDDDSSMSKDSNMNLIFSDLSALVDMSRFDCSDSQMCQLLEQMID